MKNKDSKFIKIKPKKLVFFSILILIYFLVIKLVFEQISVNISNSHEGIIFWKTDEKPVKNNFVYFDFQHELLPKGLKVLSKKLVCIGGDKLLINDNFIICNKQKYTIKRNKKTSSGKTIKQFYYDGIVPKNKAVIWGSNLESFDSRYWGFIDYNKLNKITLIF